MLESVARPSEVCEKGPVVTGHVLQRRLLVFFISLLERGKHKGRAPWIPRELSAARTFQLLQIAQTDDERQVDRLDGDGSTRDRFGP